MLLGAQPREDARVEHRAEVVRVGHERVLEALLEQLLEHAGGDERGVEVAVARRAPLERRVVRPLDRRQVVDEELGLLVLEEVEREPDVELRVRGERLQRVVAGGEGVHQDEREPRVVALAQREHLAGDDVQEAVAVLGLEQRLGAGQAHARAEAAVEAQHDRLLQRLALGVGVVGELVELREAGRGLDRVLGHEPGLARLELAVVVLERADGGVRHAVGPHLLDAGAQPFVAHRGRS